jgi:hypothetical protein
MRKEIVYLAGKIDKNDWRRHFVGDNAGLCGQNERSSRKEMTEDILRDAFVVDTLHSSVFFDYTGPFFFDCDHGCSHGPSTHGVASGCGSVTSTDLDKTERQYVLNNSERQIRKSTLFFAYIENYDAFGTLVEIGIARALKKRIFLAFGTWLSGQLIKKRVTDIQSSAGGYDISGCESPTIGHDLWFAAHASTIVRYYIDENDVVDAFLCMYTSQSYSVFQRGDKIESCLQKTPDGCLTSLGELKIV